MKCITELERRGGLIMEGVYRVPGNQEIVEDFRIALDKGSLFPSFSFFEVNRPVRIFFG